MMLKLVLVTALLVMGAEAHCHPYSCEKAKPRLQLCLNDGYKPEKLEGCKVGKGDWEMSDIQRNNCKKLVEKVVEEKCDFECEKDSGDWEQVDFRIYNDNSVTKEGSPTPKVELGKYQLKITELKTQDKNMFLNIKIDLFGDGDGKLLGYVATLMNLNLQEGGGRKITGDTRFVIEVDDQDRCNNKRDDFPILDDLNMELDFDVNSETLVKFTFASGNEYTDNAKNDCESFGKWEALMKRVTDMQMKVATWLEDIEDYVKVEYQVVGSD